MKKPDITDLRAEHTGMGLCVMWNGQGYRHHFWLNDYRAAIEAHPNQVPDYPVYRNLPLDHPDAGRKTRLLDSDRGYAKACLDVIYPCLTGLINDAGIKRHEKLKQQAAEEEQERRLRALRTFAPDLMAAAKDVVAAWESGDLAAAVRELAATIKQIEE